MFIHSFLEGSTHSSTQLNLSFLFLLIRYMILVFSIVRCASTAALMNTCRVIKNGVRLHTLISRSSRRRTHVSNFLFLGA